MDMQSEGFPHLLDCSLNYEYLQDKVFLQEDNIQLTFDRTLQIISSLGQIFKKSTNHGERIAVFLPRGIKAAISIYSIIYIGAIYVPINISDPISRIRFVLDNARPKLIIGKGTQPEWAKDWPWYDIDEFDIHGFSNHPQFNITKESSLASILHTSGSTGNPKGVALSHKAMIAFSDWAGATFSVDQSDVIANLAPFYFDLSVFDLYTSFRFGSKLIFMPQHLTLNPLELISWLIEKEITIWYTVPSMLAFLLEKGDVNKLVNSNLRLILFAGEPISKHILLGLVESLPNVEFYNLYGPVETNVCCYWQVSYSKLKKLDYVPIGFAACSDKLKIDTSTGELLVKGPSLMSGYWINQLHPHVGWYKTGDIVSKEKTGELVYKGRIDRMFKYKGFRIEPYEIEKILLSLPEIIEAVVSLIKDEIVACVVTRTKVDNKYILNKLAESLPTYMIPTNVIYFSSLPKLSNGKIDLLKVQEKAKQK